MRRSRSSTLLAAFVVVALGAPTVASAQGGTGGITGTVTADGQPVADACVDVYDASFLFEPVSDRTDGQGRYVVSGLEPGDYYVAFNDCARPAQGYAAEWYPGVASASDAEPVEVRSGQTTSGIDAGLEPAGSIAGTVTSRATGAPLAGACVFAVDADSGAFGETVADGDGVYELTNLRSASYVVFFGDCREPYTHITEVYDDVGPTEQGQPQAVRVTAGQTVDAIDAVLDEGGSMSGTVTAVHTGREVPFVCVGIWPAGASGDVPFDLGSSNAHLLTGFGIPLPLDRAVGRYVLGGVPTGDYLLEFNAETCGDDGYEVEWWRGADAPQDADVLSVTAGRAIRDLDVVLRPLPSMTYACPPEFVTEDGFRDVPDSNVHEYAIDCAVSYAITSGRADGSYGPSAPVRRDQMATFIANTLGAFGVPLPSEPADAFTDDEGNVHEGNINALAELGIVGGKGGGRYGPSETVGRGQMATFLVNAYRNATGYSLRSSGDRFADDGGTTHEGNIDLAATAGIVAGTSATTYRPGAVVRRDQMASFLARLLDRMLRDTLGELVAAGSSHGEPFGAASRSWHPPSG